MNQHAGLPTRHAFRDPREIAEHILKDYKAVRLETGGDGWLLQAIERALAGQGHALVTNPSPRRTPIHLILCTGMPRSGSTWSFNVCVSLLQSVYYGSDVVGLYSEHLKDVNTQGADYTVVKCHGIDTAGRDAIGTRKCRTVYTFREPREAVASAMVFARLPFDAALTSIKLSLEFFRFQQRFGEVLRVSYTELTKAPQHAIRRIADHLGLDISDSAIVEIDREWTTDQVNAIAASLSTLPECEIYSDDVYLYHKRTLIHGRHLTGSGAQWEDVLTKTQAEQVQFETRFWDDLFIGDASR